MKKFEYKTESFNTPACTGMQSKLNKLGKEGWELVSVCPTNSYESGLAEITAFLKREIE
ncbi:MAG: DUF4177 domain-containing protein [Bacteroidales bacterium]|nr:DUF4177 domain-containing protein [Candidatus Cacconaster equi]